MKQDNKGEGRTHSSDMNKLMAALENMIDDAAWQMTPEEFTEACHKIERILVRRGMKREGD